MSKKLGFILSPPIKIYLQKITLALLYFIITYLPCFRMMSNPLLRPTVCTNNFKRSETSLLFWFEQKKYYHCPNHFISSLKPLFSFLIFGNTLFYKIKKLLIIIVMKYWQKYISFALIFYNNFNTCLYKYNLYSKFEKQNKRVLEVNKNIGSLAWIHIFVKKHVLLKIDCKEK